MFRRVFAILLLWLCATAQSNDADTVYKYGQDGVTAPVREFVREPEFTNHARKKKIQGSVGMNVIIEKNGRIENIKVVHSLEPGLDANAIKALKEWRFKPCQKDGSPVRCSAYLEISFHLY